MARKIVDTASLVSVADAIREKGGTSDNLIFPSGFVDAISAISGGSVGNDFAIDYFSPSSDIRLVKSDWSYKTKVLNHSLGKKPRGIAIFYDHETDESDTTYPPLANSILVYMGIYIKDMEFDTDLSNLRDGFWIRTHNTSGGYSAETSWVGASLEDLNKPAIKDATETTIEIGGISGTSSSLWAGYSYVMITF